ncbi:MAG: SDR family NAD(P)-dependent oxidoreductase [Candidatus Bathyarchaeia archaeon]
MLLSDKVAIVTGGSKGIGKSIALKFAAEGASVAVVSHSEYGKLVADEIIKKGGKSIFIQCDVTDSHQVQNMIKQTIDKFGHVDILVNNAGGISVARGPTIYITDITDEDWDKIIDLNLKSTFLCCRTIVPHMKARRYGKIINISSMGAFCPGGPGGAAYHAAKAGVVGLTLDLAFELAPFNINVNAILPGPIRTDFWGSIKDNNTFFEKLTKTQIPMQRVGTPEEVAGAALFLASELSSYVTGVILPVAGGDPLKPWHIVAAPYLEVWRSSH